MLRCSSVEYARYAPFSRLAHDADSSPTAAPLFFNGLLAWEVNRLPAGGDNPAPTKGKEAFFLCRGGVYPLPPP